MNRKESSLGKAAATNQVLALKEKLEQMRQYKAILAEDGIKPSAEDKERESRLITQLLRLEKRLATLSGVENSSNHINRLQYRRQKRRKN